MTDTFRSQPSTKQHKDKDLMSNSTILVIGSTGKTGRRIAQQLSEKGYDVRNGSRRSDPPFDWEHPSTWQKALRGVDAVYISYYPDLAVPGAPAAIEQLASYAKEAGVKRLVLLSGRGETNAQRCEEIVRKSGVNFTLIRASWFSQNFDEGHLLEPVVSGVVEMPAGDVGEPFVDTDDIADVAVAALTEDRHDGQLYELTGPRLLTFAQAVDEIAKATGREIHYVPISIEQYTSLMTEQQVPADFVWLLTYLFTEVLDGRNAHVSDGVQRALGREPRDFTDYAKAVAASGVWDAPEQQSTGS